MLKIGFFGSGDFALPVIKSLRNSFSIECVYTRAPKPCGRGMKLTKTKVHNFASTFLPDEKIKNVNKFTLEDEFFLKSLNLDFLIVVCYGLIIPRFILDTPNVFSLNIHPSSLPMYRGAAPIERAMEKGEKKTSICFIKMDDKMDSGDIVFKSMDIDIDCFENSIELTSYLSRTSASLIVDFLKNYKAGKEITFLEQDHKIASFAPKIKKNELILTQKDAINLSKESIFLKIKAFASFGYLKFEFKNSFFKIVKAEISDVKTSHLDIECKNGFIKPVIVKPKDRGIVFAKDFINGLRV